MKLDILRKIQLFTLIAIVSSVSILVYIDSAYAEQVITANDTISINDTVTVDVTKAVENNVSIKWEHQEYHSDGVGFVTVIDNAMNEEPEAIDSFRIHVWSDIDYDGITLTVTETRDNNGIFEGTVFFSTKDNSSGHRLFVGNTVNAEHKGITALSKIVGPELVGFLIHKAGVYDAEDDGKVIKKLIVGQSYWILFDFESLLDTPEDIEDYMQVYDKSKIIDNDLKKSHGSMTIKPAGRTELGNPLTPEYPGHFKIIFAIKGANDNTIGANPPQFDFVVIEKLTLKNQLVDKTMNPKDIICLNDSHVLVQRTNDKLACVYEVTAEKLDWKIIST